MIRFLLVILLKLDDLKYKVYPNKILTELIYEDPNQTEAILNSFKVKALEKSKTSTQETIAKAEESTKQNIETRIKILTPNKLLTRLLVLLAKKSWKLFIQTKKRIKTMLYLLYQRSKINKTLNNNLIK